MESKWQFEHQNIPYIGITEGQRLKMMRSHHYAENKPSAIYTKCIKPLCNWAGPHHSSCCREAQQESMHDPNKV